MSRFLNTDQIKRADDRPWEEVDVPEWGGAVMVRALSTEARDKFEEAMFEIDPRKGTVEYNRTNARARLALLSCVRHDNVEAPLFAESDFAWLVTKGGQAIDRIYSVAMRLSKLSKAEYDASLKNSEPAQT